MNAVLAELLAEIDLALARRALESRPSGERLLALRRERDLGWLRSALALWGQAASDDDIERALQHRAGRFLPGEFAHQLLQHLHGAWHALEERAERGVRPDPACLRRDAATLRFEVAIPQADLDRAFVRAPDPAHPVVTAASLAFALVRCLGRSPPHAVLTQMAVTQELLAAGYPPVWLGSEGHAAFCTALDRGRERAELAFALSVREGLRFVP